VAERLGDDERAVIVFVASDAGWKYLSTGAWTADLDEAAANAEAIVYF
jgi:cysteine synthase B